MISWDGGVFQHFRVRVGYGEHVTAVYCQVFIWRKFKYYSIRLSLMLIYDSLFIIGNFLDNRGY